MLVYSQRSELSDDINRVPHVDLTHTSREPPTPHLDGYPILVFDISPTIPVSLSFQRALSYWPITDAPGTVHYFIVKEGGPSSLTPYYRLVRWRAQVLVFFAALSPPLFPVRLSFCYRTPKFPYIWSLHCLSNISRNICTQYHRKSIYLTSALR